MLRTKKLTILTILFLMVVFCFEINSVKASGESTNQSGYNSLSQYNITHQIKDNELILSIKNNSGNKTETFIENNKLILRQTDKNNKNSEESYPLPVYVNEDKIKIKVENNQITINAPIIKSGNTNTDALNSRIHRTKTWNSINKDMDDLFNFNDELFNNDEIFGRIFFDNEMKRMDKHIKNMMKMQENISKHLKNRLNTGNINITNEVSLNINDKIVNDNVIVTIEGNPLDNLDIKVKDNILTVQNKISQIKETTSENEVSKFNYNSMASQSLSLPAKVDSTKMKMDKQKDKIIVTLPIVK